MRDVTETELEKHSRLLMTLTPIQRRERILREAMLYLSEHPGSRDALRCVEIAQETWRLIMASDGARCRSIWLFSGICGCHLGLGTHQEPVKVSTHGIVGLMLAHIARIIPQRTTLRVNVFENEGATG